MRRESAAMLRPDIGLVNFFGMAAAHGVRPTDDVEFL
jgi:hypothetical protein